MSVDLSKTQAEIIPTSEKPTMVEFWAPWCSPCKMVEPIIERLSNEYAGKIRLIKVNIEENQELANNFGIKSIPTILFMAGGKVKEQVIGAVNGKAYKARIETLLKNNNGRAK